MPDYSDKKFCFRFVKRILILLCVSITGFITVSFLAVNTGCSALDYAVYAEENETGEPEENEDKELVITVVERREAVEIEESEIPLAASPATPNRSGTRHALLAGILLLCSIAYTACSIVFERRLYRLRMKAADEEYAMMKQKETDL